MNLAVCVEPNKKPGQRSNYKIWYLELDSTNNLVGLGVKTKDELVKSVLKNFQVHGQTNWRCFRKEKEASTPIEVYDFISMNQFENTHFGELPTLSEFQQTLDTLMGGFELRSIA